MSMSGRICIDELMVDCLIGCLATERIQTQRIRVDLWIELDIQRPADTDDLSKTWNYASLTQQVIFILQSGRFYLLESAGRMLLRYLLLPPAPDEQRPPITSAGLSLTKFGVLPGEATPRLTLSAQAGDVTWTTEEKPWGSVDIIDENRRMGLYRLNIAPGFEIPNHVHRRMRECEMVLTEGLHGWQDGSAPQRLHAGERRDWSLEQPHGYANRSPRSSSILCLDAPRFDPSDEVELPIEATP